MKERGRITTKNREKLRRIVVNEKGYLWNYYYDDMDFYNYPYSYYLFVPEENPRLKVRVYFTKYAPNMNIDVYSAEGTPCLYTRASRGNMSSCADGCPARRAVEKAIPLFDYKGEQCVLNLCRPYFARQMIEYVFANCCHDTDSGELEIKDGDAVLEALGYSDFY